MLLTLAMQRGAISLYDWPATFLVFSSTSVFHYWVYASNLNFITANAKSQGKVGQMVSHDQTI